MKRFLILMLIIPAFALNAQIFINTNPNKDTKTTTTTTTTNTGKSTSVNGTGTSVRSTGTTGRTTSVNGTGTSVRSTGTTGRTTSVNGTGTSVRSTGTTGRTTSVNGTGRTNNYSTSGTNTYSTTGINANRSKGTTIRTTNTTGKTTSVNGTGTSVRSTSARGTTGRTNTYSTTGTSARGTTTSTSSTNNYRSSNNTSASSRSASTSYSGGSDDVPPNAVAGKCYARCQTEDQYSYVDKNVINTPRTVKKIKLPALYNTVYDTVVLRRASARTETIPAEYETIRMKKMVSPTSTKWIKGKADAGCLSANPADCQVMCLVEVPAVYTTVTKKVLKHNSYKRSISTPMEYKIVAKQIKTQNEKYADQVIPATYKTIQERVIVKKGGYQGWREILCGNDLTSSKIMSIQKALKAAGFNPGPIDNVFGSKTKEALKAYQRAKGLPVGNLNLETLKSLGV